MIEDELRDFLRKDLRNVEKLCRMCLDNIEIDHAKLICEKSEKYPSDVKALELKVSMEQELTLWEKLIFLGRVGVRYKNDGIGKYVCRKCLRQLDAAYALVIRARRSENILKTVLRELAIETYYGGSKEDNNTSPKVLKVEFEQPSKGETSVYFENECEDETKVNIKYEDCSTGHFVDVNEGVSMNDKKQKSTTDLMTKDSGDVILPGTVEFIDASDNDVTEGITELETPKKIVKEKFMNMAKTVISKKDLPSSSAPKKLFKICKIVERNVSDDGNKKCVTLVVNDLPTELANNLPTPEVRHNAEKKLAINSQPQEVDSNVEKKLAKTRPPPKVRPKAGKKLANNRPTSKVHPNAEKKLVKKIVVKSLGGQILKNMDGKKKECVDRKILCGVCNKEYTKGRMETHMRIHTGERPYMCEICSKQLIDKNALYMHMRIHAKIKPHVCDICGKGFTAKFKLEDHKTYMHATNREFKYPCDLCDKKFIRKYGVVIHKRRIHIGMKNKACDVCGKLFFSTTHLKIHMRIHTGERPHVCILCNRGFTTTSNLKLHIKTHG